MKHIFYYNTPIGKVGIVDNDGKITDLFYVNTSEISAKYSAMGICEKETSVIFDAMSQLDEYFNGKRKVFNVPICIEGTPSQKKVWNELQKIPFGQTKSYKQIANLIGMPKAYRAVGGANNKNRILIIVPCHRVIGSVGNLVGYAGGLEIKKKLLFMESRFSVNKF